MLGSGVMGQRCTPRPALLPHSLQELLSATEIGTFNLKNTLSPSPLFWIYIIYLPILFHLSQLQSQLSRVSSFTLSCNICLMFSGESQGTTASLECSKCSRSFSNRRQILKHICLKEDKDADEEDGEEEHGNGETGRKVQEQHVLQNITLPYMVIHVCFSDPYAHRKIVDYTHKYSGNKLFITTF